MNFFRSFHVLCLIWVIFSVRDQHAMPLHTHPSFSPDLSPPDYFLFPKLKMKLKGLHFADAAEIQEALTNELKKLPKEEFSAVFQKLYYRANPVYMPMELILNKKTIYVFLLCLRLKKSVLKLLDRTVYL
jgi:hypothetical protein